ncbi:hypothetical protein [uncultured Lactobacillus sp.]|uniref:hypothetical protein n=1 Tax=uncultured Lactobacillus sp. TaxID=153152 RepID=UPI0025D8D4A7|nr:hypothetical protein [uncultured Lactobacillus sp.]
MVVWTQNLPTDSQLPLKLFQKRLQKLADSTLLTSQQQAYLRTSDRQLVSWLNSYTRYHKVAPHKIAQKLEQIQQNLTLAAALTRLRQNITNQVHYRSVSNARHNYKLAMQDLRQYYQKQYWKSGSTPHNFHGHDNR